MPDTTANLSVVAAPDNLADYVVARLGLPDDKADLAREFYTNLAPIILEQMSAATDIPFPSQTYTNECIRLSGRLDRAMPENWPLISLQSALLQGNVNLIIGSLIDVTIGRADIAIDQGYRGFRINTRWVSGPTDVFVTYTAGYDILPPDLLEVFTEWAILVGKEKDRAGMDNVKIDLGLMKFIREVPKWCQATLWRYRRSEFYVS